MRRSIKKDLLAFEDKDALFLQITSEVQGFCQDAAEASILAVIRRCKALLSRPQVGSKDITMTSMFGFKFALVALATVFGSASNFLKCHWPESSKSDYFAKISVYTSDKKDHLF
eukprot:Pompholyxophrys_punicea_v1_NODE_57_length_4146_cov_6.766521.p5 type:complete len:114 gc:universal NODE_57_length_4146_cov_6.766521:1309-968(-)